MRRWPKRGPPGAWIGRRVHERRVAEGGVHVKGTIGGLVCALAAWNALAFVIYGWDKLAARRGWRRVPEATLLTLAAAAGGPGALLAMYGFRHKTRKPRFALGVPALVAVEAGLWWAGRMRGYW